VHAVDEVFFAEEAYRAIPVAIGSAFVLAYYPRLGATARGALSVLFGLWLGGIVTHWSPLIDDGSSPGDWTSLASVPAGALFLALGIAVLVRRRELTPPASPRPG
jgi:hypothetical protein